MPRRRRSDDAPPPVDAPKVVRLPVVAPEGDGLLVPRKGVPRTGKYPFRRPKKQAKRQRPHDWARSDRWQPIFFRALARYGTLSAASDVAGIDIATVHNRRSASPLFEEKIAEAKQRFADNLEQEVARRAVEGEDAYTYDKERQQLVYMGKRRSDLLLIFLTKKWNHEFRDNQKADGKAEAKSTVAFLVQYLEQGKRVPDGDMASLPDFDTFRMTALPAPEDAASPRTPLDVRSMTPEERRALLARLAAFEAGEPELEPEADGAS